MKQVTDYGTGRHWVDLHPGNVILIDGTNVRVEDFIMPALEQHNIDPDNVTSAHVVIADGAIEQIIYYTTIVVLA